MSVGLFAGLSVISAAAAALEVVGKRTEGNHGKELQRVSSVFQEATASFGMLVVSVGFAYAGRPGASAIATIPAVLFAASPLVTRASAALQWGSTGTILKKIHTVELQLAKIFNVGLGLFTVQMTNRLSGNWKAFSSLIAVGAFANTFPWFVSEVEEQPR